MLNNCRSLIACFALMLSACGGGGGGSSSNPRSYTIGGTVSGLVGSVVLQNNGGSDLTLSANGNFTFATPVSAGSSYSVTVLTQPEMQSCAVATSSGTAGANVTNVAVTCGDVAAPVLSLTPQSIKVFHFSWTAVGGGTRWKLLEDATGSSGFTQAGADIAVANTSFDLVVPLHYRVNARYRVQACAATRCIDSNTVNVTGTLAAAVGYIKASNTGAEDQFAGAVALSADGLTLAVGAGGEDASVAGGEADNSAQGSGAVYVFARNGTAWQQQAYLKASNADSGDLFGRAVSLSGDGSLLAVGAHWEDSNATGINGNQADDSAHYSGAAYIFKRSAGIWTQQAYIKASNTEYLDQFGATLALSANGATLAVGAIGEDGAGHGTTGNQADNSASESGAVYVFLRDDDTWQQVAYIKASNTEASDRFGVAIALSSDGETLAVGASDEDSDARGIDGNQADNSRLSAGAVYVFRRGLLAFNWSQEAYIKPSVDTVYFGDSLALSSDGATLAVGADSALGRTGTAFVFARSGTQWAEQARLTASNAATDDGFGNAVSLSGDGTTLAVGAVGEDSAATGVNGNETDNSQSGAGAVYVFERSGTTWSQRAYLKPPNSDANDTFGTVLSLSSDGATLAVGANQESSDAAGIGGDGTSNGAQRAGAAYLF